MKGHPVYTNDKESTTTMPIRENPHQRNPLFDDSAPSKKSESHSQSSASGIDSYYSDFTAVTRQELEDPLVNQLPEATNIQLQYFYPGDNRYNDLAGPMVVRVKLDGSPVEEDKTKPLPKDDDREIMTMGREKVPTVEQLDKMYPRTNGFIAVLAPPTLRPFTRIYGSYRTNERNQYRFF